MLQMNNEDSDGLQFEPHLPSQIEKKAPLDKLAKTQKPNRVQKRAAADKVRCLQLASNNE